MLPARSTFSLVVALCSLSISVNAAPPTDKPSKPKPGGQSPPSYTITEIPPPPRDALECEPGFATYAYSSQMNESLHVVAAFDCYVESGDPDAPFTGSGGPFAWNAASGSYHLYALYQNPAAIPSGINNFGDSVGFEWHDGGGYVAPYWPFSGGVREAIDPTSCGWPQTNARAYGVNDGGDVVGTVVRVADDGRCRPMWVLQTAAGDEVLIQGAFGSPRDINNKQQVVGNRFMWSPSEGLKTLHQSATNYSATAYEINELGESVGVVQYYDANWDCLIRQDAYLWDSNGSGVPLPSFPDAPFTLALGVNDLKWVVGYGTTYTECGVGEPSVNFATLWIDGVAYDLNDFIPKSARIHLTSAKAITNTGAILAGGRKLDEGAMRCPSYGADPTTGLPVYDDTPTCPSSYLFLLTPNGKGKVKR